MPNNNKRFFAKGLEYQVLFYFKSDSSKQVFKALRSDPSTRLRQEVLVKLFLEDHYKEEFESLSQVDSPYCVRLLGFENFGSKKALVLEYVKACSLFEMQEHFSFNDREISYILTGIYKGLKDLQSFGLCHGDLSLDNVLIDDKAHIKLIDFGLANYQKVFRGTKPFMAPELLKGFRPNFLSDLYALGVLEAFLKDPVKMSGEKPLSDNKPLLSPDPVKRKLADRFLDQRDSSFDKSSLIAKVKELLLVRDSRRFVTVKNPVLSCPAVSYKSRPLLFFKWASLFLLCFLGTEAKKEKGYGLIKIYTHEWFFIESSQFRAYTPAHFFLKEGTYYLEWKNRLAEGQKKLFVPKNQVLLLGDEFFLKPSQKSVQLSKNFERIKERVREKGKPNWRK